MKYKIGDKVIVREDLIVGKFYGFWFNKEMAKLKGKVVEIKAMDGICCYIKEDTYYWTEEMFSGFADEPRNLIPLIAKELGVEIGEEFKISNQHFVYKFKEDGLMGMGSKGTYDAESVFFELINGKGKIIKLPKKPKLTEAERVILENLPKEYKHIKRLTYGGLYIYDNIYDNTIGSTSEYLNMFSHLFQFIKQEDKEPYNIEELLKGE